MSQDKPHKVSGELAKQLRSAQEFNRRWGVKTWQLDTEAPLEVPDSSVQILAGAFPRLFISYRWESAEHESWMDFFAGDLFHRGYDVVFDRDPRRFTQEIELDELLAMMSTCQLFVPVITTGYVQRIMARTAKEGGPVRQEWELALQLGAQKKLGFIGVWRCGDVAPAPFTPDNVADFRDLTLYHDRMNETFPFRQVVIVGRTPKQTLGTIGPMRREQVRGVIEQLVATKQMIPPLTIQPYRGEP